MAVGNTSICVAESINKPLGYVKSGVGAVVRFEASLLRAEERSQRVSCIGEQVSWKHMERDVLGSCCRACALMLPCGFHFAATTCNNGWQRH